MHRGRFTDGGVGVAAIATAATLQPWPSPAVVDRAIPTSVPPQSLATAFALVALAGFLARRYGWIDRRITGALTVLGSGGLVCVSLAVLVVLLDSGTTVTLWVPFTAVLGIGSGILGVVEWSGLRAEELLVRSDALVVAGIVAASVLVAAGLLDTLFRSLAALALTDISTLGATLAEQVAGGVGAVIVAGVSLHRLGHGIAFLDVRWPDTRDSLYCVGGFIGLLLVLLVGAEVLDGLGVSASQSGVAGPDLARTPVLFFIVLSISALLVGPAEELLFRNVIQKTLYATFTRPSAVVLSSTLYAGIYLPAYSMVSASTALGGVVLVFALSVVLGITYDRTRNLFVPALIHGAFNAFQYAVLYVAAIHELGVA